MHDDKQKIRGLIGAWLRATSGGNLPELLRLMDEDVVFLTPGQPPMRGREAFASAFQAALQHFRIEATSEIQEVRTAGDLAYCWSHLRVTMTPLEAGSPMRRKGYTLTVFTKNRDGAWVLARDANLLGPDPPSPA
jgi:uncharacterized protein (TIGR02246 family)